VRIETLPLIIGVLVAVLGIGIMFDAWKPDAVLASQERRRRPRIERHRNGEAMIGLGVLALAAAFIGRDNWRYSILVVIIGAVFLVVGTALNGRYVRELFVNRGPLRRREVLEASGDAAPGMRDDASERPLIVATDAPMSEHDDANWGGVERRKTPRERGGQKKSSRRDAASGDSAAT
jgi:hypothetical protein